MIARFAWIGCLIAALALAGCKTTSVSRVYSSSYDRIWDACLRTVNDQTGQAPSEADKSEGRMVTEWTTLGVAEQQLTEGTREKSTLIHAVITLSRQGKGTKVTVAAEQRTTDRESRKGDPEYSSGGVQFPLNPTDTSWQRSFLDKVAERLRAGK